MSWHFYPADGYGNFFKKSYVSACQGSARFPFPRSPSRQTLVIIVDSTFAPALLVAPAQRLHYSINFPPYLTMSAQIGILFRHKTAFAIDLLTLVAYNKSIPYLAIRTTSSIYIYLYPLVYIHPLKNENLTFARVGRILAIDYGTKRTGLAWTDPAQKVAMPLTTLSPSELWQKLPTFLTEVEKIIVGYPRTLRGEKNDLTIAVERFVADLHKRYPTLLIELVEERFSTQASLHILRQLPPRQRRDKALCDRITASLLLENYLLRHS